MRCIKQCSCYLADFDMRQSTQYQCFRLFYELARLMRPIFISEPWRCFILPSYLFLLYQIHKLLRLSSQKPNVLVCCRTEVSKYSAVPLWYSQGCHPKIGIAIICQGRASGTPGMFGNLQSNYSKLWCSVHWGFSDPSMFTKWQIFVDDSFVKTSGDVYIYCSAGFCSVLSPIV